MNARRFFLISLTAALIAAPYASAQLLAYFPFNESAADASGNANHGTLHEVTFTATGRAGTGAVFNGTNSYVDLATLNINASLYPQLTMGAWVKAANVSPIRQVISHDDVGFDRSLGIDFRGEVTGWSAFVGSGVLAGAPAVADDWTFVAVVFDQTAATATLYVNDQSFTANRVQTGSGWNFTRIGMNPSFGEYFSGTIDEVFFFSTALSPEQVTTIRTEGVVAAVPEPSTYALLALGTGLLLIARRRV